MPGRGIHEPGAEMRGADSGPARVLPWPRDQSAGGISSSELEVTALEAACFCQDADGCGRDTGPADARTAMNHLLPSSLVLLLLDVCPCACDVTFAMT